jgi:hypothetical protein
MKMTRTTAVAVLIFYCIGLAVVMLGGPGSWSFDAVIATLVAT